MTSLTDIPQFGALIIGDEILSGKRQDAHLPQVIRLLSARGLRLAWAHYLSDDLTEISKTLQQSITRRHIVFVFGGIGATPDDHTRQAAAQAIGVPIERHAGAVAEIEARFGEAAYPKRVLMADFPQGAALIPNPVNRVPGFSLDSHHFLPGFPEMAWPMLEWVLDTHYPNLFHQHPSKEAAILVFDAGESRLIDLMNEIVVNYPELKLFSLPKLDTRRTIELGVRGPAKKADAALARIIDGVEAAGFPWQRVS